jgi:NAD(P)-dependent dehydrogenase (short-subunit alcohol dehydrogenase family)
LTITKWHFSYYLNPGSVYHRRRHHTTDGGSRREAPRRSEEVAVTSLSKRVALVAGATRGAGRAIARALGEAGATVYCTGRNARGQPTTAGYYAGRPETIEETAELVDAAGGAGIAVRVDHSVEAEVAALFARVRAERGRLDLLVNVFWGGPAVAQWGRFWTHPLDAGRALLEAPWAHVITCRHATPLMVERASGLIVQITDGDSLAYRQNLFYDLARVAEIRLAYALAQELAPAGVTALAVTPGYMRTEAMLDALGVTEGNWQEGVARDPTFAASESPAFVGRAVVALATDPDVARKSGGLYSSWGLAEEYGFTDVDGRRPNIGPHLAAAAGERDGGARRDVGWHIGRGAA